MIQGVVDMTILARRHTAGIPVQAHAGSARRCRQRVAVGSAPHLATLGALCGLVAYSIAFLSGPQSWRKVLFARGVRAQHGVPGVSVYRRCVARRAFAPASPPYLSARLQRLELNETELVGAGCDLVDVRIFTPDGDPQEVTFMLDTGLTTNLIAPELLERLRLPWSSQTVQGAALGGEAGNLPSTFLPGLEVLGDLPEEGTRYAGVWEGDGWRARCELDWDGWVASSSVAGGKVVGGAVEYTVLPSMNMSEAQAEQLVGRRGIETVEGVIDEGGSHFRGRGVSAEPKGFLKVCDRYEFRRDGDDLVDPVSGLRLRRIRARPALTLRGPLHAAAVPFLQSRLAKAQGIELGGMLGQFPLHRDYAVEILPARQQLHLHPAANAAGVAQAAGLMRLPGEYFASGLFGVALTHAPLLSQRGQESIETVPAIVDSGSANTILNWPAAEKLLGLKRGDRIVKDAPIIRTVGVGGGKVDMPLLTVSIGLLSGGNFAGEADRVLRPRPVRVAVGDAGIFEDLVGREEKGSWPFGLGPKALRPAALIGQDILSQQHYILAASEPALYMAPPAGFESGKLEFIGIGDCLDAAGRRLRGLQKLATTLDEAAFECLRLPAGNCQGVAVTPRGRFQGLAYIFVESDRNTEPLIASGWRRYAAPQGQELAPLGAVVEGTTGEREADDAQCFAWRKE